MTCACRPADLTPGACRRQRGFTLVELMVTLTVAAVLMAVAVPSFREFTSSQKVKAATSELSSAVLLARSEAIKRNVNVTLTPETGTDWLSGWNVKVGDTVLHKQQALTGVTVTTSVEGLTFQPTGRLTGSNTRTFQFAGTSSVRCVRLDLSGIPNTKTTSCS